MRLFVAIPLSEGAQASVAALMRTLPVGRWPEPESLHLTLAFLGEVAPTRAEAVDDALAGVAAAPFAIALGAPATFEGADPRVVFLPPLDPGPLAGLNRRIRGALHAAGVAVPRETYRPHVTIAWLPVPLPAADAGRLAGWLAAQARFRAPPFPAGAMILYRSHLHPGGARHEPLAEYPFG